MSDKRIFVGGEFLVSDIDPKDVFTPEDLSKEHRMFYQTTLDFVVNEVHPKLEELDKKDYELHMQLVKKAGELGIFGPDVPEEYGGLGLDKMSAICVADAVGSGGSFAVTWGAHTGIGILPLVFFGSEEQKKKWLPLHAMGEAVSASCLTEPGAGSDALSGRTSAKLSEDGNHWILNGEKLFITNAGISSTYIVYAKVDDEKFTTFLVEKGTPGLVIGKEEKKMGGHGSSTCPVIFEDCKIPKENLIYEVGQGHKSAFNCLNIGRLKLGASCTGGAKRCITEAVRYANGREQFGQPISNFGMIKEKLANMTIKTFISDSILYRVTGMLDDKIALLTDAEKKDGATLAKTIGEYALEFSITKIFGSECLDYVVDEYVQTLGGYGYCSEYPAERAYRDSRINRIWEGTNEINRMLIPGTMLKRAMQGQLNLLGAAQEVAKEIIAYSPLKVDLPDAPLAVPMHTVKMAKKLALMLAGVCAQKFGPMLEKEQEVMAIMADSVMEIFAMESGILRTQKKIDKDGEDAAKYEIAAVKCYVDETMPKIQYWAGRLICFVEDGEAQKMQMAAAEKLAHYQPIDTITLKKEIANRVIDLEAFPFFDV